MKVKFACMREEEVLVFPKVKLFGLEVTVSPKFLYGLGALAFAWLSVLSEDRESAVILGSGTAVFSLLTLIMPG